MATFKICVFDHQRRKDGKYPVSIRVCWNRKYGFIKTEFYATAKQITRKELKLDGGKVKKIFELKDSFIISELNTRIKKFEEIKVQRLGYRIEQYTAKELAEYFVKEARPGTDTSINFIEFSRKHCEKLISKGRKTTAGTLNRTINAIIDYCNGRENISIIEITAKFLDGFEAFLKSERTIKRKNQFGKMVTTKREPVSDVTVFDYMTDIRTLFNAALDEFNDEDKDEIRIRHYPFRKYKLKPAPEPKKRNLTIEQIRILRDKPESDLEFERTILARDVFMLSFYLAGMNMVDIYNVTKYKNGRLEYEREKTKNRRKDRAFISIKVEPEALPYFEKYKDKTGARVFDFHQRYSSSHIFSSNVNKGLKNLAKVCDIDEKLTTYYARHSWATIARNKCGISKDDIDLALNHVDQDMKMADAYIDKDWSLIDQANRKVLELVNEITF